MIRLKTLFFLLLITFLSNLSYGENPVGVIYKISNTVNDKVYIGLTTNTAQHRFSQHMSQARREKSLFYQAVRDLGKDKFSVEVLEEVFDLQELQRREIYYIALHESFGKDGYNSNRGGALGWTSDDGGYGLVGPKEFSRYLNMRRIQSEEQFYKFPTTTLPPHFPARPDLAYKMSFEDLLALDTSPLKDNIRLFGGVTGYRPGVMVDFETYVRFLIQEGIYTPEALRERWINDWDKMPIDVPANYFHYDEAPVLIEDGRLKAPWTPVFEKMQEICSSGGECSRPVVESEPVATPEVQSEPVRRGFMRRILDRVRPARAMSCRSLL